MSLNPFDQYNLATRVMAAYGVQLSTMHPRMEGYDEFPSRQVYFKDNAVRVDTVDGKPVYIMEDGSIISLVSRLSFQSFDSVEILKSEICSDESDILTIEDPEEAV